VISQLWHAAVATRLTSRGVEGGALADEVAKRPPRKGGDGAEPDSVCTYEASV
jgi:hypothetical protein